MANLADYRLVIRGSPVQLPVDWPKQPLETTSHPHTDATDSYLSTALPQELHSLASNSTLGPPSYLPPRLRGSLSLSLVSLLADPSLSKIHKLQVTLSFSWGRNKGSRFCGRIDFTVPSGLACCPSHNTRCQSHWAACMLTIQRRDASSSKQISGHTPQPLFIRGLGPLLKQHVRAIQCGGLCIASAMPVCCSRRCHENRAF